MSSRQRTVCTTCPGIARISAVALLALLSLAGLIPSGALSAAHACQMACCATKPPHEAGACNAILPGIESTTVAPDEKTDEHSSHHDPVEMSVTVVATASETGASPGHCQTAKHSSAQHQAPRRAPTKTANVAARTFDKPCSAECAAAVLTLTQARRPRESAAHSIAASPRPPTLIFRANSLNILFASSAELRRQSRPRAPPAPPVNFSA